MPDISLRRNGKSTAALAKARPFRLARRAMVILHRIHLHSGQGSQRGKKARQRIHRFCLLADIDDRNVGFDFCEITRIAR